MNDSIANAMASILDWTLAMYGDLGASGAFEK